MTYFVRNKIKYIVWTKCFISWRSTSSNADYNKNFSSIACASSNDMRSL